MHFYGVYRVHGGKHGHVDKASSRFSTPVLKTPEGEILCDSADILRYVSQRFAPLEHELYPVPEVAELEQHLHDELGPHTRRFAYGALFQKPALLRQIALRNVSRAQGWLFAASMPFAVSGLRKALGVTDERVARSIDKVRRELDAISQRLADGRRYLVADRFTAADLAFASLAAPVVFPAEYSAFLPDYTQLPDSARSLIEELRATPAGAHALRMFREERHRVLPARAAA
jgi:glutathione S-transferase